MIEKDGIILSLQNVRWRTIHGYAGISNLLSGLPPGEFLNDLNSVCMDIRNIREIEYNIHDGLIPFLSDLKREDLQKLKLKYKKIEEMLDSILGKKKSSKKKLKELIAEIKSAFDILDTISPG